MAERIKVGLIYSYQEQWIAGAYYIENLVHALNALPDALKPSIVLLCSNNKDFERINRATNYPYINWHSLNVKYNIIERVINKVCRTITKRNFIEKLPTNKNIDVLFPSMDFIPLPVERKIYWIPDFQEDYLPHFFSEEEVKYRKSLQKRLSELETNIVFSSQDALNDFERLYPKHVCKTYVLRFAVTHPSGYKSLDIQNIRQKYNIPKDYFFVPNQFWVHKNHILVLKALQVLKSKGEDYCVAFSGKQEDYRSPNHFEKLKDYVQKHQLEENIRFLGFIDRAEQLALMKHAKAVIQPSLFEGWSTVVEDVKAMNQMVILSDLKVHREQTENYNNKHFFNPHDEHDLATKIQKVYHEYDGSNNFSYNYQNDIERFGKRFVEILRDVIGN